MRKIRDIALDQIARPTLHRLGTAVGSGLVAYSIATPEVANTIAAGVTAALGLAFDLIIRRVL